MANPTLLDIAKLNAGEETVGLIEEAVKATPEVAVGSAMTISGVNYNTSVRTGLPTVGFRSANEGVTPATSTYINRLNSCNILNAFVEADKVVADSAEGGAAGYMALEAVGILQNAYITAGKQFFYGVDNDAKGYAGLTALVDSSMVVDALGDDADECTSAYLVRFGPRNLTWIYGNNSVLEVGDMTTQRLTDSSGNVFTGYQVELLTRIGLALHNKYSIARICNIDTAKPLTDDLIAEALAKFPIGGEPNAIFVNRRGRSMLQQSRTATNVTGAPAPFPTEAFGIPVYATESIGDTEAVVS